MDAALLGTRHGLRADEPSAENLLKSRDDFFLHAAGIGNNGFFW
jgi:hypothetical protein